MTSTGTFARAVAFVQPQLLHLAAERTLEVDVLEHGRATRDVRHDDRRELLRGALRPQRERADTAIAKPGAASQPRLSIVRAPSTTQIA